MVNSDNNDDMSILKKGKKAMIISAILTLFIAVLKYFVGYIYNSVSLMADGLHSFSDVLGPIIVYTGLKILFEKKPSENFPYGYARIETFASLLVSIIIFLTGFEILFDAIKKLNHPTPIENYTITFITAVLSLIITYYLYIYKKRVGKELGSDALISEGEHSLVDCYTTVAVLFAIVASYMGYYIIEPIAGILISIIVIVIGLKMMKRDIYYLLDYCDSDILKTIKEIAQNTEGVLNVHDLKCRKAGPYIYCEMHIEVDENIPLKDAHKISEDVSDNLKKSIKNLGNVIIHIDPVSTDVVEKSSSTKKGYS